jgi:dTDP-4-dehydrorhamnose reductase
VSSSVECLVIGAAGLIGRHVGEALGRQGIPWLGTSRRRAAGRLALCDITRRADVRRILRQVRPRVVFHCANAPGGVDGCERAPAEAAAFHLQATQELGRACRQTGAALVFISTDYVFRGDRPAYREDDPPSPPNVYGRLKLEAERWIQREVPQHVIARTTNVYGWDPESPTPNYLMQLYRTLAAGRRFSAASYLWGTPTHAADLAQALVDLSRRGAWGLFHVAGPDVVNRLTWAREAARVFGLEDSLIDELAAPPAAAAPRPGPCRLLTEKFARVCPMPMRGVREGLERMRREMECLSSR